MTPEIYLGKGVVGERQQNPIEVRPRTLINAQIAASYALKLRLPHGDSFLRLHLSGSVTSNHFVAHFIAQGDEPIS
jgi:hypothetical protein